MTRSIAYLLHRASEHLVSSAGAIVMTVLLLVSVDARAANHAALTPSVSILVPRSRCSCRRSPSKQWNDEAVGRTFCPVHHLSPLAALDSS
jgi:hypothetical protein